jgi:hypothetical protein
MGEIVSISGPAVAEPPLAETCRRLMDLQGRRRFCIKSQSRCDRSIEAFLARLAGYHSDLEKTEREALFRLAAKIRKAIEKAGPDWQPEELGPQFRGVILLVLQSRDARAGWDLLRQQLEAEMRRLAGELPAWPWVREVKGVGELGLAVIVGETGDLDGYANPAKVWKRLGLAVFEGRRQGNPGEAATKEDWIQHGYNRQRRAEIWAFLSDVMFRAQWRGEKDGVPAHPIGHYGEVYAERKAWDVAREWTPKHADNDARRYMSKRFLRDLWGAWRRETEALLKPNVAVPPAAE